MILKAHAKLNLALDVTGKRADGYHNMNMIMQSVELGDTLTLEKREKGIALFCDDPSAPCDRRNLAWKAAEQFFAFTALPGGISVRIEKRIPAQAGMAGGSADAAAVLVGLNELYKAKLPVDTLCRLGKTLGADVPFCIVGGTAHVTGIGEVICPLQPLPTCFLVIVKPEQGISTQEAFQAIDEQKGLQHFELDPILSGIAHEDLSSVCQNMGNVFEQVTVVQDVFTAKQRLLDLGAEASLMSGSGSAVFGVFRMLEDAEHACRTLQKEYPAVFQTVPVEKGIEVW
ncbi:MAG: 4-(cytidine 5'-diphospho)-2-C-methyl-D-erythritol kinase [Oscillospiraceae bacterium]|jgi:4-diphosphocytidyl-2-C-methyl-D-erythritol kinase